MNPNTKSPTPSLVSQIYPKIISNIFQKQLSVQVVKSRILHVEKFMQNQMVSSYNAMVTIKGRRVNSVFSDFVKRILSEKKTEVAVEAAMREAAKKVSESSFMQRMLG